MAVESMEAEAPVTDIFGRAPGTPAPGSMGIGASSDAMLAVLAVSEGASTAVAPNGSLRDCCRRWATFLPNWRCSPNSEFLGGAGG